MRNAARKKLLANFCYLWLVSMMPMHVAAADPLPSWNAGLAKQSMIDFVTSVTDEQSDNFVAPSDRIAVFDNDETLWPEVPLPFRAAFACDEVKRRAPQERQLAADPMVQAVLEGNVGKLLKGKHHDGLLQVMGITHAGMKTDEFDQRVNDWLATAKHPRFNKAYSELTYQPMQELLAYLRASGFKCFIVSGGGADFMRVWSERVYGIPPENVVGSMGQAKYDTNSGSPLAMTRRAGPPALMDQERKFTSALQKAARFRIAETGLLHLSDDAGEDVLRFSRIND